MNRLKAVADGESQWGREFRARCDLGKELQKPENERLSQWGREFRARCDAYCTKWEFRLEGRLNGAANSARAVTR